jgi:hypothetical protein
VGTSKPSVVETNVSQSAGSKASLAVVGRMALFVEKSGKHFLRTPCYFLVLKSFGKIFRHSLD